MADNQGDQVKLGDTNQQQVDMVPKADYEKLQTSHTELTKTVDKLKQDLDEARLTLLDPRYIKAMEQGKELPALKPAAGADLDSMSRAQLVELIVNKVSQQVTDQVNSLKGTVGDMMAGMEVKEASAKYSDFWEYKDAMRALVKKNDSLTIDDAYKLAKANRQYEKSEAEKQAAAKAVAEKPGGIASSAAQPANFKNKEAAADDAWSRIVGDKNEL